MSQLFDLSGQTALVTGARRGIGLAFVDALAAAGADIIGVSAALEAEGSAAAEVAASHGRRFEAHAVDFADRGAVTGFADELRARQIDILVNNAGTIERAPAREHPAALWDRVIDIDLNSQFVLTQAVAAGMLDRGHGRIIFTASLLSFQGGINVPGYAAAKSGIVGLVHALSNEWSGLGVTVNAIAPGYIATDNTQALRDDPARRQAILDRIPVGRWGAPEDLASAVVFLAAPSSAYVTGIVVPVDGGWLAR